MNIEIKTAPPKISDEQEIYIDQRCVGIAINLINSAFKFHIILKSELSNNIYQGFGQTIDEALRDAIESSKILRAQELNELDRLENSIWGE